MRYQTGDQVRVTTSERTYDGVLMPRPEIFGEGFLVLKLESGYNIGIKEERVKKVDLLKKHEPLAAEKKPAEHKEGLPTVSVLSFGGTISSKVDYRTGGAYADYTAEDFVAMMPELAEVANLRARKVLELMSEDMNPQDWQAMAEAIAKELNDPEVSGVVVTQGTDTLHYSTAAMSFFLSKLDKPVVFTAAQRSIDRGSSDAFMNLLCSVHAATKDMAEVMTCMHGSTNDDYCLLIRGTKVRKMHTSRRDAFRPINELPFGKIWQDGKLEVMNKDYRGRPKKGKAAVKGSFEEKVGLVQVYPGMDPDILDVFVKKGYRGLVVSATALGHVPTVNEKYSLLGKLQELTKKGCLVVIASQTIYGRAHPYVYSNLRKLSLGAGCVFAEDMLPEVAYVKLGWTLGQEKDAGKAKRLFLENIAGEMTGRSDPRAFLF